MSDYWTLRTWQGEHEEHLARASERRLAKEVRRARKAARLAARGVARVPARTATEPARTATEPAPPEPTEPTAVRVPSPEPAEHRHEESKQPVGSAA